MRSSSVSGETGRLCARRLSAMARFLLFVLLAAGPLAPSRAQQAAPSAKENYERLFVLANTEFTLLHEIAHVLIWEIKPPVFGREEDAADTIAIMAQMMLPVREGEGGVIEKLQAVADGWHLEWQLVQEDELDNAYWDMHSLEIQRYYNISCLVYGADPENRVSIVKAAELPVDRAEWCHEEYAQAKHAMDWLFTQLTVPPVESAKTPRGKMTVRYEENTTLDGEKLNGWLRQSGIAERLAEAVTRRFSLPRDVEISFEGCPFPNAAWDADSARIQFCHALLNRFMYLARELKRETATAVDGTGWHADSDAMAVAGSNQ